jgi:hypothetical protein
VCRSTLEDAMTKFDDGSGPYDYCKRGLSHCQDQFCDCVDNPKYRAYYQMVRHRLGWSDNPSAHPRGIVRWFVICFLIGALLAVSILVLNFGLRVWLDSQ